MYVVLTNFPLSNSSQTGEKELVVAVDGRFDSFHGNLLFYWKYWKEFLFLEADG